MQSYGYIYMTYRSRDTLRHLQERLEAYRRHPGTDSPDTFFQECKASTEHFLCAVSHLWIVDEPQVMVLGTLCVLNQKNINHS